MKKKILSLSLMPIINFLVSCSTCVKPLPTLGSGYINKVYSSGAEVSWKGNYKIISVHDGDTFTTRGGIHIRLFSVDTPEMSSFHNGNWINTNGLELLWAKRARDYVRSKILNKNVTVIFTNSKTYNRRVGAVFYQDQQHKIVNLAFDLIKSGLARKAYISIQHNIYNVPNKYYYFISNLEGEAQEKNEGVWCYPIYKQKIIFPKWKIVK